MKVLAARPPHAAQVAEERGLIGAAGRELDRLGETAMQAFAKSSIKNDRV